MALIEFCCPQCKGMVETEEGAYRCASCQRSYPLILGIPDFRVFPDSYIGYEDDYEKAAYLFEQSRRLDFTETVRLYWKITPNVSEGLAERFIRHSFALVDKAVEDLKKIEELSGGRLGTEAVLEIGCGTGGFLVAASRRFRQVVGYDIAFRWLIVARKRLEEAGLQIPLVCGCAEYMPFKQGAFDFVVAEDVIEHVKDQEATLNECRRVANDNGIVFLSTPNRFSLTSEPHVRVWGVGFLPRSWMDPYVRAIKGVRYEQLRLVSLNELKRLLRKTSFHDYQIILPSIPEGELRHFSAFEKLQVSVYELVKRTPVLRLTLYLFGPFFHVLCYAAKDRKT